MTTASFSYLAMAAASRPDLVHHAQDAALAGILLEVLILMQLVDGLRGRRGQSWHRSANPFGPLWVFLEADKMINK